MDPTARPDDVIATDRTQNLEASPRISSATGKSRKRKLPPTDLNRRATFPRKRSVTACQLCRTRKTKCNNDRPVCSQCLSLNARCVYEEDEASAEAATPANQILERLEYLISLVEPSSCFTRSGCNNSCNTDGNRLVGHPRASGSFSGHRASTITAVPRSDTASNDNEAETSRHTYFGSGQDVLDWPVFEGKYDRRWIEALIFDPTLPCDDLSGPCTSPRVTDDTIRNTYRDPRQASGVGVGVREDDVLHLVETFLVNVHVKNPIFDPEYLRGMARGVAEHGFSWQASSCLVVRNQIRVQFPGLADG
jgi:hypothetical protein